MGKSHSTTQKYNHTMTQYGCADFETISEVEILQMEMFRQAKKFETNLIDEIGLRHCESEGSVNCMNGACHFCVRSLRAYLIAKGSKLLAKRGRGIHVVTFVDTKRETPIGKLHEVDAHTMCQEVFNALQNITTNTGKRVLAIGAVEACLNDRQLRSSKGTKSIHRSLLWAPHTHFVATGCTKRELEDALQALIPRPQRTYHSPLKIEYSYCTTRAIAYATKRNTMRRVVLSTDGGEKIRKDRKLKRVWQMEYDAWLAGQHLSDRFVVMGLPDHELTAPALGCMGTL
jgi:hypothetical protein